MADVVQDIKIDSIENAFRNRLIFCRLCSRLYWHEAVNQWVARLFQVVKRLAIADRALNMFGYSIHFYR
jgi:hypothetical protein